MTRLDKNESDDKKKKMLQELLQSEGKKGIMKSEEERNH